jgi:hypothetical protein
MASIFAYTFFFIKSSITQELTLQRRGVRKAEFSKVGSAIEGNIDQQTGFFRLVGFIES